MLTKLNTEIIYDINENNIERAAKVIRAGGLVAFPTETVYGLGANALLGQAALKIYAAKGRPSDNPLIIHLSKAEDAEKYCFTGEIFYKLASRFMPGPITIILPKRDIIPFEVTAGLDTVAVRVPSNKVANKLIEKAQVPIAAPSANLSGRPSPTCAQHVIDDMMGRVDMILAGEECEIGLESTVVSVKNDIVTILRPGKVTYEELKSVCPNTEIAPAVLEKFSGKPLSPGMKYKHYSPKANVIILEGDYDNIVAFLSDKDECGILCFDSDTELLKHKSALSIGSEESLDEQARKLFACLREFDKREDITTIYARMPSKNGLGLAVYNRLIRAAGFETLRV